MRKKYIYFLTGGFLLSLGIVGFLAFYNPSNINTGIQFAEEHSIIGPLLLVIWRVLWIIFPFFPAGIVSFAVVPIFGWFYTYIYTLIGILVGTSIAFFLSRIFRERLVERFLTLKKIHKMEDEMTKKKEFIAIVALKLFTVPVMDFSSYIAGLTKISYKKFALAVCLASFPNIFTFYLGEEIYKRIFGKSLFVGVIGFFIIGFLFYLLKKLKLFKGGRIRARFLHFVKNFILVYNFNRK